jgi:putative addiction module killer protein
VSDGKPRLVKLVLGNRASPIDEWLASIRDKLTRARIARALDKLGRGLPGPHRSVGQGVNELKLDFGPGYRVYYAEWRQVLVVLLGGGDKSSQQRDIELARQRWGALKESDICVQDLDPWDP